ncbi:unnamed protein product [Protopolystoma xenopodis]|uniref:Uncharacterized protein n=1 Tax=Protopolystoma xenopodis TaxID=117903 RepID=A0A448WVB1_9PLAT|nr:unnamed protein product [Protopolystoma xenopodis]
MFEIPDGFFGYRKRFPSTSANAPDPPFLCPQSALQPSQSPSSSSIDPVSPYSTSEPASLVPLSHPVDEPIIPSDPCPVVFSPSSVSTDTATCVIQNPLHSISDLSLSIIDPQETKEESSLCFRFPSALTEIASTAESKQQASSIDEANSLPPITDPVFAQVNATTSCSPSTSSDDITNSNCIVTPLIATSANSTTSSSRSVSKCSRRSQGKRKLTK